MIRKRRLWLTAKYLTYTLTTILLYAIQTAPGLFSVKGIRPMWVIPFAVGIAMCEEALSASLFGMLAGLLCDLGTQSLFGFNGLLMLAGCCAISLLATHLVKANWKSALLLGGALAAARALLEFFFFYLIWGYEKVHLIFIHSVIPTLLYTGLLTPLFLWAVRPFKAYCHSKWEE